MTILVVEDVAVNALILRNILQHAEYRVVAAGDGVEALEAIAREPDIDLVLTDVHMPRMSGIDLVRRLREDPETHDLPVIFVTGEAERHFVIEAVGLGTLGYILKPILEPSKVLQQVETALAGWLESRSAKRHDPSVPARGFVAGFAGRERPEIVGDEGDEECRKTMEAPAAITQSS